MNDDVDLRIGAALAFYAKYPLEMELLRYGIDDADDDDSVSESFFADMEEADYRALTRRVERVYEAAEGQARAIIDHFSSTVLTHPWSSNGSLIKGVDERKRKGPARNWCCEFRVRKKWSKVEGRAPIHIGMDFENDDSGTVARSWIWVRGVDRGLIYDVITQNPAQVTQYDGYRDWGNAGVLMLAERNVYEAAQQKDTVPLLVESLFSPYPLITNETWDKLFYIQKESR